MEECTITITFGDQAENHVGMQKLGKLADCGFNFNDLVLAKEKFENIGCFCEMIHLSDNINGAPEAYILIVRNGLDVMLEQLYVNANDLLIEQENLEWDTKAKMYGRVVNKKARYNLCYNNDSQEPDYMNGKGRIIAFDDVPWTKHIRDNLHVYIGDKAKNLVAEGNMYYSNTCGISWHGDSERKKVVAVRLGQSMSLCYHWYLNNKPIGDTIKLELHHGDLYIMSENATGYNWKKKKILTLRHAAGNHKYTTI